jgi:hypothetical protein
MHTRDVFIICMISRVVKTFVHGLYNCKRKEIRFGDAYYLIGKKNGSYYIFTEYLPFNLFLRDII